MVWRWDETKRTILSAYSLKENELRGEEAEFGLVARCGDGIDRDVEGI